MAFLIDTDVVVHLRDGEQSVWKRTQSLDPPLAISAMGRIELENGVHRDPAWSSFRRAALDKILETFVVLNLTAPEITAYCNILETVGFSKRKVADRLTAATALVHGLTLITMNGKDFQDVPGLKLVTWPSPATPHPPSAMPR